MSNKGAVKGKSTLQLTQISAQDLMKLNEKELRQIVSRMADAANKRMVRGEKAGVSTPAMREAKKGGKFSTKGLNLNELRAEYARTRDFLRSKTSTAAGWKKVKKDTIQQLRKRGVKVSDVQFENFWRAYERLKESHPEVAVRGYKYKVAEAIADEMVGENKDIDDIVNAIDDLLDDIYERGQAENDGGVSEFFTLT